MSTDIAPKVYVTLDTGERFDLTLPDQVLALEHAADDLARRARQAKAQADEIIRGMLEAAAVTALWHGIYEATEETGKATYDADAIYAAAVENGVDESVAESQFKWVRQVKDGKELNKLANRQEAWQRARDAGTKRSRGRIVVKMKQQVAPAPATPEAVKEITAVRHADETAAGELGI